MLIKWANVSGTGEKLEKKNKKKKKNNMMSLIIVVMAKFTTQVYLTINSYDFD